MKKLMTMLAAVATAFGLYAADEGFISGAGFDTSDTASPTKGVYTWLYDTESSAGTFAPKYWANTTGLTVVEGTSIEDEDNNRPLQFIAKDRAFDGYLNVETKLGNPVGQYVKEGGDVQGIGDGLYFDALVKPTVFDADGEPTATIEDDENAKIGIYAQMNAAETETNLYVYAGSTPAPYKTTTKINDSEWIRLTIKMIENINKDGVAARPGYVVFVNGTAVRCSDAILPSGNLKPEVQAWNSDGALFESLTLSTEVKEVLFDGKGSVDEIAFTTTAPKFAEDFKKYTITWDADKVGTVTFDPAAQATNGTTVTFMAQSLPTSVTMTWTATAEYAAGEKTLEPTAGGSYTLVDGDYKKGVAKVDEVAYAKIDDAIDAAVLAAKPVVLLAKAGPIVFDVDAAITLDLNGFNVEAPEVADEQLAKVAITVDAGEVTITNSSATAAQVIGSKVTVEEESYYLNATTLTLGEEEQPVGTLTIQAGNFTGFVEATSITGGFFSYAENVDSETGDCLLEGLQPEDMTWENDDAWWFLTTVTPKNYVWVAADDDSAQYETIAEAIAAGETSVKLIDAATIAKETFGGDIAIDLDGKTLTGEAGSVFDIMSGTVTISNGAIVPAEQTAEYDATVTVEGGAQVTFGEALTVSCNKTMAAYATDEGTFVTVDGATIQQVGTVMFNPDKGYKTAALTLKSKANAEIVSGTITGEAGFPITLRGSSNSTLTIGGGTFGAGKLTCDNDDTVVINGGVFNGSMLGIGSGSKGCTINAGTFNNCVWPGNNTEIDDKSNYIDYASKVTILGGSYVTTKPEAANGYTIPAAKKWVGEGTAQTPWTLADKTPTTEIALSANSLELTEGGEVATLTATPNGDYGFTWSYAASEYVGVTENEDGSLTVTGKLATVEAFVVTAVAADNDQITASCSITVKAAAPADPIPPVDPQAGEEVVNAAIDAVDYADKAAIKAAIGGDAQKYNDFAAWAKTVDGGQEAVIKSTYAAKSFQLAPFVEDKVLFTAEPTLTTTAIAADTEAAGNWTFTVKLTDGAEGELVKLVEGIANCAKVSEDLETWNDAKATAEINDGIATIKITPPEETDKAFMKVEIK